jgi:hypothetical protein
VGEALLSSGEDVINVVVKKDELTACGSKLESICKEHADKKLVFVFVFRDKAEPALVATATSHTGTPS